MKSLVYPLSGTDVPSCVKDTVTDVIEQWEKYSCGTGQFNLRPNNIPTGWGVSRKDSRHTGKPTPNFTLNTKGGLTLFYNEGNSYKGVYYCVGRTDCVVDTFYTSYGDLQRPTTDIDLCNIQPHEYGMLKLMYGWDKSHLFLPTQVKEIHYANKAKQEGSISEIANKLQSIPLDCS